jgi:hypothetical protein
MEKPGMPLSYGTRILVFQEGAAWTAQGLECDIAAQGKDPQEAMTEFKDLFQRHIALTIKFNENPGENPLLKLRAAPEHFWKFWDFLQEQRPNVLMSASPDRDDLPENLFATRLVEPANC